MTVSDLNENHLRRLRTAMAVMDAAAGRVLGSLDSNDPSPINIAENPFSSSEKDAIEGLIRQLRSLIWGFAQKYGLEPHRKNVRRAAVAEISKFWTILEGLHANQLRGMGVVSQATAQQLNGDVDSMLKVVEQLRQLLFAGAAE